MFNPKNGIPSLAAARLQTWGILFLAYHYNVQYCSTSQHSNADILSSLLLATSSNIIVSLESTIFNIKQIDSLPVTVTKLQQATRFDPVLARVFRYYKSG